MNDKPLQRIFREHVGDYDFLPNSESSIYIFFSILVYSFPVSLGTKFNHSAI